jgi:uncharacterized protein
VEELVRADPDDRPSDLELGRFVDHHCHPVVHHDLTRPAFEALMSEASGRSPLGTTLFDSMLGLAIRRWCAPVLGLEALASADAYLDRRLTLGATEANARLVEAAGIETFLVDTGIRGDGLGSANDLASLSAGSTREIVRLETLAEDILRARVRPSDFVWEFEQRLRSSGAVAAKSIAAYRTGLDLPSTKPSDDALVATLTDVYVRADEGLRLAEPIVHGWLAWTAIDLGLPLQIHVGYGDSDLDLLSSDPLRLTPFLRATEERLVPVLLLHNYPFHRQAAYLAQVFDHVFMDVGLATHNTGALSEHVLREALELVPFGKLLFSSDAYGLAELYLLGSRLFRRNLETLLTALVEQGEMTLTDASYVGALVGRENARRVYRLDDGGTAAVDR